MALVYNESREESFYSRIPLDKATARDINKMSYEKLTPYTGSMGNVYFTEERMIIECRKVYFQDIVPGNFLKPGIGKNYPIKDYHRLYIGEIIKVFDKK